MERLVKGHMQAHCTEFWMCITCCQACTAVLRECTTCCPKFTHIESTITVQSSSFSAASWATAICPKMLRGFTTLCIVTFLHSRSLQSAWAENRISWQTELLFHCRRYRCGSLKAMIMYSSSEGTFLSEINGCRYCGGAVEQTNKKNSSWEEPIFYGNKGMTFKLCTFWLLSSLFAA